MRCTAPCCLPPTQIDPADDRRLLLCAVANHRIARAITPTVISTVAKAKVNASRKSVSISDLYIVSPLSGESRQALRCERDKASPRLKLASFGNLRGRTRGKFVVATIAPAIMNRSSCKIKKLENSHSQYVESALITFSNVLPARSVDN
jgi:hypothetical protein